MLSGQGFIALIPALIVVATVTSATGVDEAGSRLIDRFGLTGSAADGVRILFAYPPGAAGGVTVLSVLLLLVSLNGFAAALQRTFEAAWGLPRMGVRGAAARSGGFVVLIAVGTLAGWVGRFLDDAVAAGLLGVAGQLAILLGGWLLGTWLMLSRRRTLRELLVGAFLGACLELAVGWASAIYLPPLFQRNAERYGVVGVALALVTWLIAVAATIVGGAVVGAVLGDRGPAADAGLEH